MALRPKLSTRHDVAKSTRRIIEKYRDLEFGRKLEVLYAKRINEECMLCNCLENLKSFFVCSFGGIYEMTEIESAKNRLISNIDRLLEEINKKALSEKTVSGLYITAVIASHRDLFNLVNGNRITLNPCLVEWSSAIIAAVYIWGNRV
jgi:hypothetical protein